MEVVSTSNLVSLEAEKITTARHFQTMPVNSFFVTHDSMRSQIGGYEYMQI